MIITNGGSAVEALRQAGLKNEIISWDDVLHDGPVPAGLSHHELIERRAMYISSLGWGSFEQVWSRFKKRDAVLNSFSGECILLWFEHDLYDQLQLLQILHGFATNLWCNAELEIICDSSYVGESTSEKLLAQFQDRRPLTNIELNKGKVAWEAFVEENPMEIEVIARSTDYALPFVPAAFKRLLQFYPDEKRGLSRIEFGILSDIQAGTVQPIRLFQLCQNREESKFLGDWSFWIRLNLLIRGGLIRNSELDSTKSLHVRGEVDKEFLAQKLDLTELGRNVLVGDTNFRSLYPEDEQWIGGTCLTKQNLWVRDPDQKMKKVVL